MNRCLILIMALSLASCGVKELTTRVETLSTMLMQQSTKIAGLEASAARAKKDLQSIAGGALCTDQRVRDFLTECRSESGCKSQDFERNLEYMNKQPHVIAFLDPRRGVDSFTDLRKGQLATVIDQVTVSSFTSLLVVTMPTGGYERQEGNQARSQELARGLRNRVLELHPKLKEYTATSDSNLLQLKPQVIGCNNTTKLLPGIFAKQSNLDKPEAAEPKVRQPQVIAWIFLVNC